MMDSRHGNNIHNSINNTMTFQCPASEKLPSVTETFSGSLVSSRKEFSVSELRAEGTSQRNQQSFSSFRCLMFFPWSCRFHVCSRNTFTVGPLCPTVLKSKSLWPNQHIPGRRAPRQGCCSAPSSSANTSQRPDLHTATLRGHAKAEVQQKTSAAASPRDFHHGGPGLCRNVPSEEAPAGLRSYWQNMDPFRATQPAANGK